MKAYWGNKAQAGVEISPAARKGSYKRNRNRKDPKSSPVQATHLEPQADMALGNYLAIFQGSIKPQVNPVE